MEYVLKRSKRRKTISVEVSPDCRVVVRAPYWVATAEINRFLEINRDWINKQQVKAAERLFTEAGVDYYSKEEIEKIQEEAVSWLLPRLKEKAEAAGISYSRGVVKPYKSKWGSCNAKGVITLNALLMELPEEIRDYVIVHELCHRREMNHSRKFWSLVEAMDPEYREHRRWLRDKGRELIAKLGK